MSKSTGLGKVFRDGETIVKQGEAGNCMYVIQEGEVEVIRDEDGEEVRLVVLGENDFFGEVPFFERSDSSGIVRATVRTLGSVRVLTVDRRTILRRIKEDPSLAHRILQTMSRRVREIAAIADGGTGLANRRFFTIRLEAEANRAMRYMKPVGLLMIDIDDFRAYNDRYGHASGDEALKQVAAIIRDNCRRSDMVGRYGGEEFAVMLLETDLPKVLAVGKRIRQSVEVAEFPGLDEDPRGVQMTVSIGVSSTSSMDLSSMEVEELTKELVSTADHALHVAKESGRNKVCASPEAEGQGTHLTPPSRAEDL